MMISKYNFKHTQSKGILLICFIFVYSFFAQTANAFTENELKEKYLLHKYQNQITKDNKGYNFKTQDGNAISLSYCKRNSYCKGQHFIFKDFIEDKYLVFKKTDGGAHWDGYAVVNVINGDMAELSDFPYFTPDYTKFVSIRSGGESDSAKIELYEINNNKFQLSFKIDRGYCISMQFNSWNANLVKIGNISNNCFDDGKKKSSAVLEYNQNLKKWEYKEKELKIKRLDRDKLDNFEKRFPEIRNYYSDKDLVRSLLKERYVSIRFINKELFDDKEIIIDASRSIASNFKYASDRIKNDKEFVIFIIRNINKGIYRHLPQHLKESSKIEEIYKNSKSKLTY